jgi:phage terminase small subunit
MNATLTDKQERFVHEYLIDHNASAAAQRAGYSCGNRRAQAADLMQNRLVRERIDMEMGALFADLKISARQIMREQARVAFFRPLRMFDATGRALPLAQLDPEIAEVLTIHYDDKDGKQVLRVRQPSRLAALNALDRRLQAWLKIQLAPLPVLEEEAPQPAAQAAFKADEIVLDYDPRVEAAKKAARQAARAEDAEAAARAANRGKAAEGAVEKAVEKVMETATETAMAAAPPAPARDSPSPATATPVPDSAAPAAEATAAPATPVAQTAAKPARLQKLLKGAARKLHEKLGAAPKTVVPGPEAPAPIVRRDPELLWGGKRAPTPEPEPNPLIEQHIANVRAAEQRAELFGKFGNPNERIRPGMPQRPPGVDLGYNPPHLRRDSRNGRPQYAIGAGECSFDGYGDEAVM